MTLWNAEGLKPIKYLVWPLRSLKLRNPFLTLTWPGDLTFGDLGLKFLHKVSNLIVSKYWKNGGAARRRLSAFRKNTEGWAFPPPPSSARVNLRPAGGGVFEHPSPCGFSRIARKRRRAAPPGFHLPYPPSFWQLLWKFRSWVMQGQVTRSGQVTIPFKNFTIAPQLQCLRESYETFGIW